MELKISSSCPDLRASAYPAAYRLAAHLERTALKFVRVELIRELPLTESLIGDMKLHCTYKDVTF